MVTINTGAGWELSHSRAVAGRGVLEYCAVDSEGSGLLVLCHSNYLFVGDSVQPVAKPNPQSEKSSEEQPKFTFQQSDGEGYSNLISAFCFMHTKKYQPIIGKSCSCVMSF